MTRAKEASKRKPVGIDVPERGEDPAERKRLLNVLAQRRYRQRRKLHVKSLEVRAGINTTESAIPHSQTTETPSPQLVPYSCHPVGAEGAAGNVPTVEKEHADYVNLTACYFSSKTPYGDQISHTDENQADVDPFAEFDPSFVHFPVDSECGWNPSMLLPSLPSTPSSSAESSSEGTAWSLTSTQGRVSEKAKRQAQLQYSFPDEINLQILETNLLRGAVAIAQRLHIADLIWSLTASSPFTEPDMALADFTHLPPNLRPTLAQLTQPHHPILDLFPWPSVRDKLIMVFSQPADVRPKIAASPTALIEFVYDVEDSAEGVRIWGDDPYSDQAWEVGEKVFQGWWWAFDRDVIRRSNELKRRRGALPLTIGSVLGELQ